MINIPGLAHDHNHGADLYSSHDDSVENEGEYGHETGEFHRWWSFVQLSGWLGERNYGEID